MDSVEKQVEDFTFASDLTLPVTRVITRLIAEGARGAGGRPSGRGRLCVGGLEVLRVVRTPLIGAPIASNPLASCEGGNAGAVF
ncbi:hypothetical protein ACFRQM_15590 [Streptomyces sp. NPDC056831]|uniref:hypothetical protein n=1 Tax=Streptomyces sp. NPDC056831 TaxID=3345954 RepID=UPI0036AB876A